MKDTNLKLLRHWFHQSFKAKRCDSFLVLDVLIFGILESHVFGLVTFFLPPTMSTSWSRTNVLTGQNLRC